jgi:hypothetical protein
MKRGILQKISMKFRRSYENTLKTYTPSRHQWLMPVILATQEVEISSIAV